MGDRDFFEDSEDDSTETGSIYFYLAPMLYCRHCRSAIELPYSNLPQTDRDGRVLLRGEDPPELPPEGWSKVFGCCACGRVLSYGTGDVNIGTILKLKEGSYQSGKGVYSAKFPCGEKGCTLPVEMFADIGSGNASDLRKVLRSGRFRLGFPCGHEMKVLPEFAYEIEPVLRRLW